MLRSQLYRVFVSPVLWVSAAIYAFAILYVGASTCIIDCSDMGFGGIDVFVYGTNYVGSFITLYLPALLCALPCAGLLQEDVLTGSYKYAVLRGGGISRYLTSKLLAAAISACAFCAVAFGLAVTIGCILYPGAATAPAIYIRRMPIADMASYLSSHNYAALPLWTVCFTTLNCVTFAILGLSISSLLRNRYLIYSSGLICFILWSMLSGATGCISCTISVFASGVPLTVSPLELAASNLLPASAAIILYYAVNLVRGERYV